MPITITTLTPYNNNEKLQQTLSGVGKKCTYENIMEMNSFKILHHTDHKLKQFQKNEAIKRI